MTDKQRALRLAEKLGVDIEISYNCWQRNRIERITLLAPDGYLWEGDRHVSCAVQRGSGNWDYPATQLWKDIIRELNIPLEQCSENCYCKDTSYKGN
jgi:hypothetical protein|tara:strand:+ start:335 stop:625 length:291 start_codon:yes stop_codon:yes gene_type:complete